MDLAIYAGAQLLTFLGTRFVPVSFWRNQKLAGKKCVHCQRSKNHHDEGWESRTRIEVFKTRGWSLTTAATPMTWNSPVMRVGLFLHLTPMPAVPSRNRFNAAYVTPATVCRMCLTNLHCQAKCSVLLNHVRERLESRPIKNVRN